MGKSYLEQTLQCKKVGPWECTKPQYHEVPFVCSPIEWPNILPQCAIIKASCFSMKQHLSHFISVLITFKYHVIIRIYYCVAIALIYCRSTLQTYLVSRRSTESMEEAFGRFYHEEEAVVNPFL